MADKRYVSDVPGVKENDVWRKFVKCEMVVDKDRLQHLISDFKSQECKILAIDTETTSLDFVNCDVVGYSFCFGTSKAYYIPLKHKVGKIYPDFQGAFDMLAEMMHYAEKTLMYNYQWDARILRRCGIDLSKIVHFDVMALIWNLDTNIPLPSLKDSSLKYLGVKTKTFTEVTGDANSDFSFVPSEEAYDYAAIDAWLTFMLYKRFTPFYEQNKLIVSLDNEFARSMMWLEEQSVSIDINRAKKISLDYGHRIDEMKKLIYAEAGRVFDIDSPAQLSDVMISNGIPLTMRTPKTNRFSTKADAINNLAGDYPFVKMIQEYRTVTNELSKNVVPFLKIRKDTCNFKYIVFKVPTGRLSSGGVKSTKTKNKGDFFIQGNAQSTPKPKSTYYRMIPCSGSGDSEPSVLGYTYKMVEDKHLPNVVEGQKDINVRQLITTRKDHLLVSIDHVSQELVLAGNVSGDNAFIGPLSRGEDLHTDFSDRAFGKESYSESTRKDSKGCNFLMLYGGSAWALKKLLPHKSDLECQEMLDVWERLHVQYLNYNKKCSETARKTGFVKTQFGRIRRVGFWYKSYLKKDHYFADRTVKNTQIQGLGADIMRYYICKFYNKYTKDPFYKDKVRFVLSLHDEFVSSVTKDPKYFTDIVLDIGKLMCDMPFNWPVPLTVSYSFGHDWGSLFPFIYKDEKWTPDYLNKD